MRVIPLIPAILSLILGLSIGLVRFGWEVPLPNYELLIAHSTLMVCGFFGTLICLERSVVIDHPVAYTVPLICGLGVLVQIYIPTHGSGSIFFLAAAVGLLIIYMLLPGKRDAGFYVQVAGAAAWVVGTGCLVATWPSFVLVPWWISFLLLTIVGERLELSRFRNPSRFAVLVFSFLVVAYLSGATTTLLAFLFDTSAEIRSTDTGDHFESVTWIIGQTVTGLSGVGMSLWLVRHDLARTSLRRPGLARFTAVCLLAGYGWLALSGITGIWAPGAVGGPMFDARLHTVFLGFVLSMVFGHALIIGPGVFRITFQFHRGFYAPLLLLHLSVGLRYISDMRLDYVGRSYSGILTVASVALFMFCMIISRCLAWRIECRQSLT